MLTKTNLTCFVPGAKPKKFIILDIITDNLTDSLTWSYPEPLLSLFDFMMELLPRVCGNICQWNQITRLS